MSNDRRNRGSDMGFPAALLLTFIILKLIHVIDWSWWWVLSPFWIPLAAILVGCIALILFKKFNR